MHTSHLVGPNVDVLHVQNVAIKVKCSILIETEVYFSAMMRFSKANLLITTDQATHAKLMKPSFIKF